jgi:hypothetical protein
VCYFGNLAGETGDAPAAPAGGPPVATGGRVNALDLSAIKRALNATVGVGSRIDVNHDGRINALDLSAIKGNLNLALAALTAPTTPPAAAARPSPGVFGTTAIAAPSAPAVPRRTGVWELLGA